MISLTNEKLYLLFYSFIQLINLFNDYFTVTGSGTYNSVQVQLTMLERFSVVLAIYMML